jgi:hypothetical protein
MMALRQLMSNPGSGPYPLSHRFATLESAGRPERVKEIRMGEPATPPDGLFFHYRDMCCWSAKGDRAKPQKR